MSNNRWNQFVCVTMLCVGAVSFLFGLLTFLFVKPEGHTVNTLMGMFTGFGAGILGVAVVRLMKSDEKREQEEIERQDERNVAIMRAAGLVGYYTAIGLFALLVFLFMGLGYSVPSYICLAAMYAMIAVTWIARRRLSGKM